MVVRVEGPAQIRAISTKATPDLALGCRIDNVELLLRGRMYETEIDLFGVATILQDQK